MNRFIQIATDPEILAIYEAVALFEKLDEGWAHHDFQHVSNVADMVESLLTAMHEHEDFIEEAKIAAILHDVGAAQGKEGHAERGALFAKEYLEKHQITLTHKKEVIEAIRIHSDGFETDNLMALVLILADKLDIKYTRVAEAGSQVPGMRQLCFINDISLKLQENILEIYFSCDEAINRPELEAFYFTKKVFRAIGSFSNKLGFSSIVYLNEEVWAPYQILD
ncbi:hypothetical protein IGI37_003159 [Enterococcus sp. AZ194]|uniref:HD domain-containing protein n=1 Tax=Enterococcus sp. AZ194 TaxID=2774629 RepID=UPI003F231365